MQRLNEQDKLRILALAQQFKAEKPIKLAAKIDTKFLKTPDGGVKNTRTINIDVDFRAALAACKDKDPLAQKALLYHLMAEVDAEFKQHLSRGTAPASLTDCVIHISNLDSLSPDLQTFLQELMNASPYFDAVKIAKKEKLKTATKAILQKTDEAGARNKFLRMFGVTEFSPEDDLWKIVGNVALKAIKKDLKTFTAITHLSTTHLRQSDWQEIIKLIRRMGLKYYDNLLQQIITQGKLNLTNKEEGAGDVLTSIQVLDHTNRDFFFMPPEILTILQKHLQELQALSIKQFGFKIKGDLDEILHEIEQLLPHLNQWIPEKIRIEFVKSLSEKEVDLLKEKRKEWLTRFPQLTTLIEFHNRSLIHTVEDEEVENEIVNRRRKLRQVYWAEKLNPSPPASKKEVIEKITDYSGSSKISLSRLRSDDSLQSVQMHVQMQEQSQEQQQEQQQQQQQQQQAAQDFAGLTEELDINLVDREIFCRRYGAGPGVKSEELWDKAVGRAGLPNYINYLTHAAARMLTFGARDLFSGLNLTNLPPGFFLKRSSDHKLVLDYDSEVALENKNKSPLTPILHPYSYELMPLLGDQRTLRKYIEGTESQPAENRQWVLSLLKKENPDLADEVIKRIDNVFYQYQDVKKLYPPFIMLFAMEGCAGLNVILKKLELFSQKYSKYEYAVFFNHLLPGDGFIQSSLLLRDDVLASLDYLATLTPPERTWWLDMFVQHRNVDGTLPELTKGFKYFVAQYRQITGRSLPEKCDFAEGNFDNMLVGMDRLLGVLKHAKAAGRLDVQLQQLRQLDLGPEGAYYACQEEGLHFATPAMQLAVDGLTPSDEYDPVKAEYLIFKYYVMTHAERVASRVVSPKVTRVSITKDTKADHLKWKIKVYVGMGWTECFVSVNRKYNGDVIIGYSEKGGGDEPHTLLPHMLVDSHILKAITPSDKQSKAATGVNKHEKYYRLNTEELLALIGDLDEKSDVTIEQMKIHLLRYLAGERHMAPFSAYHAVFQNFHEATYQTVKNKHNIKIHYDEKITLKNQEVVRGQIQQYVGENLGDDGLQSPLLVKQIMSLIVLATTHERGVKVNIEDEYEKLQELISGSRTYQMQHVLDEILKFDFGDEDVDVKPTLTEVRAIAAILLTKPSSLTDDMQQCHKKLRKLIKNGKEKFLSALVNRLGNPHAMDVDAFIAVLMQQEKKLQGQYALLLSIINASEIKKDEISLLLNAIDKFEKKHHDNHHMLLDILSNIDVGSPELPSIKTLCDAITSSPSANYTDLLQHLQTQLPNCRFTLEVPAYEHSIMSFLSNDEIDEIIGQAAGLGIELDKQQLMGPQPIKYILSALPAPLKLVVLPALKPLLVKMVKQQEKTAIDTAIAAILPDDTEKSEQTKQAQSRLRALLVDRLKPGLKNDSLDELLANSVNYCEQVKKLADHLATLKAIWPGQFEAMLKQFADPNQSKLGDQSVFDLSTLNQLLPILIDSQRTKKTLSPILLNTLFAHEKLADKKLLKQRVFIIANIEKALRLSDKINTDQLTDLISCIYSIATVHKNRNQIAKSLLQLVKEHPNFTTNILAIYNRALKDGNDILEIANHIANLLADTEELSKSDRDVVISHSLQRYEQDPAGYDEVIKTIESKKLKNDKRLQLMVVLAKCQPDKQTNEDIKTLVTQISELKNGQFSALTKLYQLSPCPHYDLLAKHLSSGSIDTLLTEFPNNPYGERDVKIQFDISRVDDVLNNIADLSDKDANPLATTQRTRLKQWFNFVNKLGYELPIYQRKDGKGVSVKDLTTDEVQELVKQYRAIVSDPERSEKDKLTARLCFLAISREMMYRTTGLFPNSTQMLALLNDMMQGGNILTEIQTGQGKSLIQAMTATQLWLEGGAVDVTTTNSELARRDFAKHIAYFDGLGIKHGESAITRDSKPEDYVIDGINYSDNAQLAIYRGKMQIEGHYKEPVKVSLVMDEADFPVLDDSVHYRYAKVLTALVGGKNPYEWIYPVINELMIPLLKSTRDYISLDEIRDHLMTMATAEQKKQVQGISDKQLDTWIRSSAAAIKLREKENIQFAIKQITKIENGEEVTYSSAQIIIHSRPNPDTQWSNGVHQFLHALLENERKEKPDVDSIPPFEIEPEIGALVSTSCKNFIDYYRARGCVRGKTGTSGSAKERQEEREKYQFKLFSLPPHQKNIRVDQPPMLAKDREEKLKLIGDKVMRRIRQQKRWPWQRDSQPQPLIIFAEDVTKSKELYDYLAARLAKHQRKHPYINLQLYNGVDTLVNGDTRDIDEKAVVEQAGKTGWITISTPMLSRGTDISPIDSLGDIHRDGLSAGGTGISDERTMRQLFGRAGRQGQAGESWIIVNEEDLLGLKPKKYQKMKAKEAKKTRMLRDMQSDVKNCVFAKFITLHRSVSANMPDIIPALLREWKSYLEDIETVWTKILEENASLSEDEKLISCTIIYSDIVAAKWNKMLEEFISRHDLEVKAKGKPADVFLTAEAIQQFIADVRQLRASKLTTYSNYTMLPVVSEDVRLTYADMNPVAMLGKKNTQADRLRAANEVIMEKQQALLRWIDKYSDLKKLHKQMRQVGQTTAIGEILTLLLAARRKFVKAPDKIVNINQQINELLRLARWSNNQFLMDFAFKAYMTYYQNLLNDKADQKQLSQLKIEILSHQRAGYFGNNDFNKWLKEHTSSDIKDTLLQLLSAYQKDRSKVTAADRKTNAAALMDHLNDMDDSTENIAILALLIKAKNDAMRSDLTADKTSRFFKRNITDSRYQQTLQTMFKTMLQKYGADEIDTEVDIMYQSLADTMDVLAKRMPSTNLFNLKELKQTLLSDKISDQDKIYQIMQLKEQIAQFKLHASRKLDRPSRQLLTMLQQQCDDFELYCKQGKDLNKFLQSSKVTYFNATSRAIKDAQQSSTTTLRHIDGLDRYSDDVLVMLKELHVGNIADAVKKQFVASLHDDEQIDWHKPQLTTDDTRYVLTLQANIVKADGKTRQLDIKLHIDPRTKAITADLPHYTPFKSSRTRLDKQSIWSVKRSKDQPQTTKKSKKL